MAVRFGPEVGPRASPPVPLSADAERGDVVRDIDVGGGFSVVGRTP